MSGEGNLRDRLPKGLLENLEPGEEVRYYVRKRPSLERPKWLVVTDRRIIYFDQKILGRYDMVSVPFEKLERVELEKGLTGSTLVVRDEDGRELRLGWLGRRRGVEAVLAVKKAIESVAVEPPSVERKKGLTGERWVLVKPREIVSRSRPVERGGGLDELMKLKMLLDEGAITREEYEEAKKRILGEL